MFLHLEGMKKKQTTVHPLLLIIYSEVTIPHLYELNLGNVQLIRCEDQSCLFLLMYYFYNIFLNVLSFLFMPSKTNRMVCDM